MNIEVHLKDFGDIKLLYSEWFTNYINEWRKHNPGLHTWNYPVDGEERTGMKTLFNVPDEFLKELDKKGFYFKEV